jgi:hypothetical protein
MEASLMQTARGPDGRCSMRAQPLRAGHARRTGKATERVCRPTPVPANGTDRIASNRPRTTSVLARGTPRHPDAIVAPYDFVVDNRRPSIGDVAGGIATSLRRREDAEALRIGFRFIESFDAATMEERHHMVAREPPTTGDDRFDALVAAVVEFACARHSSVAPTWVDDPKRFLSRWWFISGMSSLHANAIAHSPISFARRGVFVTEDALTYA